MRRALSGLLPTEILHRREKAFVARSPLVRLLPEVRRFLDGPVGMLSATLGFVNEPSFRTSLQRIRLGRGAPLLFVLRTLALEQWLQCLERGQKLCVASSEVNHDRNPRSPRDADPILRGAAGAATSPISAS
jgi:hypothetical protein